MALRYTYDTRGSVIALKVPDKSSNKTYINKYKELTDGRVLFDTQDDAVAYVRQQLDTLAKLFKFYEEYAHRTSGMFNPHDWSSVQRWKK